LQALSGQVMEAQETERRRLAIVLHDELGQALTAIKINLQAQDRFSGQTRAELNTETVGMVEDALRQVRRLALALRPPMLDDLGLVPALRWIAEHTEAHDDLVVRVHANNLASRPAPKIETACFRIAQESLTNIVRHAKAHFVEIDLSQDVDALVLCVKDDGCGFDVAAMRKRALAGGSMGMLGMQERAALIGGQLDIASAPGQGSRVRLSCPLRTQTAAA
jgi:signal transduction histidine kinase